MEISYIAPPTVKRCFDSDARVKGLVGPIGSGKSSGCVVEALRRSMAQKRSPDGISRVRGVVVRNTYRELNDTTRKTFEQWWPVSMGKWNEADFSFRIKTKDIDWEVLFRALDKPGDVKKVLSLELTWAYINECREIPKDIFDGLQGRVGRYPSKAQGGPTWYGLWFDSNPWHTGHWADELFRGNRPDGFELYEQPSGLELNAENLENLPIGYYKNLCAGKDSEWIACYIEGKYPSADKGSIYGALLADLDRRGGLDAFVDIDTSRVFTSWDLGGAGAKGDATAIWFWCFDEDRNVDLVDHYEANGKPISHYFDKIREFSAKRGYKYERHFLPHDSRAVSLQTGMSTEEMFRQEFGGSRVTVLPNMPLADGIGAARWLLEQSTRIHPRCSELHDDLDADGIRCLREYRREWDEDRKMFSNLPLHNWASHSADAFRYVAIVVKEAERRTRQGAAKTVTPDIRPSHMSFSLDELWEANARGDSRKDVLYR